MLSIDDLFDCICTEAVEGDCLGDIIPSPKKKKKLPPIVFSMKDIEGEKK